jgi:hypothetical protein
MLAFAAAGNWRKALEDAQAAQAVDASNIKVGQSRAGVPLLASPET